MEKKGGKGKYWSPHPLDWEIIKRLPRQGSMLGYHTIASTVKHLKQEMNSSLGPDAPEEAKVDSNQINGRLVSMQVAGLVTQVTVISSGGTKGWQRTQKGEKEYTKNTGKTLGEDKPHLRVARKEAS
jgi:hypothetical protein